MALSIRRQPRQVKKFVRHFFTLPPYVSLLMPDGTNRYYSATEFFILFMGAGMHVAHAFNLQSSHIRSDTFTWKGCQFIEYVGH